LPRTRRTIPGPALAGAALAYSPPAEPEAESPMYTVGSQTQDGVNLGTAVRPDPEGSARSTASNLDTHSAIGSAEVRMLLSFQRPPHLRERGIPLRGTPGSRYQLPGQTHQYSALEPYLQTGPPRAPECAAWPRA